MRKFKFTVTLLVLMLFAASSVFAATTKKGNARAAKKATVDSPASLAASAVSPVASVPPTSGSSTASASSASTSATASVPSASASSTTSSASASDVKKTDPRKKERLHMQVGVRVRSFNNNNLNTASQALGFETASSDQTSVQAELSVQLKFWKFAVEYLPLGNVRTLDTSYYGASLGGIKVTTSNVVLGKFFPVDSPEWSLSVGIGAENTKITGSVAMGGFDFPTTGNGWSPVFQLGGQYHLTNRFSLGLDYERSNVRLVTRITGVPDIVNTSTDRLSARLMFGVF